MREDWPNTIICLVIIVEKGKEENRFCFLSGVQCSFFLLIILINIFVRFFRLFYYLRRVCLSPYLFDVSFALFFSLLFQWLTGTVIEYVCVCVLFFSLSLSFVGNR